MKKIGDKEAIELINKLVAYHLDNHWNDPRFWCDFYLSKEKLEQLNNWTRLQLRKKEVEGK